MENIDKIKLIKRAVLFFISLSFTLTVFEFSKYAIFPRISVIYHQLMTILLVSAVGAYLSYYYFLGVERRNRDKEERIRKQAYQEELTRLNTVLEQLVEERTNALNQSIAELRKLKERAVKSDQLRTVFYQNISHEIRTPLNGIIGFSQLLPQHFENKNKLVYYAEIIRRCGSNLLDVINDTIEISKIETGQVQVVHTKISLTEFFNEIESASLNVMHEMGKIELEIKFSIPDNFKDKVIITDRNKLKQVFDNLIYNALRFTTYGYIEIGCVETNNSCTQFFVADSGTGFSKDDIPFLFKDFFYTSCKGKIQGSGLGLAIAKGLVELLGGEIFVNSLVGKGSVFVVTLPCNQEVQPQQDKTKIVKAAWLKGIVKTVCIVESDTLNTAMCWDLFYKTGTKIRFKHTCHEAISQIKDEPADIIIVDAFRLSSDDKIGLKTLKQQLPKLKIYSYSRLGSDHFADCDTLFDGSFTTYTQKKEFLSKLKLA